MIDDPIDDMSGMDKKALRTAYLISGYMQQTLTDREKIELDDWINQSRKNLKLFEELTDPDKVERYVAIMQQMNKKRVRDKIDQRIYAGNLLNRPLIKGVIAASIIGIAIITFFMFFRSTAPTINPDLAGTVIIKPGSDRATLKLSDGSVMILDSMQNGVIKNEKGILIHKSADGQVEYTNDSVSLKGEEIFNTISTPKGGQYKVTLSDGTKTWLNAASSIKYPVAFNDTVRTVEITGEVYFEVAKNKIPFVVKVKDAAVKVLGTHFNIDSYKEVKTILLEGSVRLSKNNDYKILKPGEMGIVNQVITIKRPEYPDDMIAWKNGYFRFSKENIKDIMEQLARWYKIDVSYEGNFEGTTFTATARRNENISTILKNIEKAGHIHFKIEGTMVKVIP